MSEGLEGGWPPLPAMSVSILLLPPPHVLVPPSREPPFPYTVVSPYSRTCLVSSPTGTRPLTPRHRCCGISYRSLHPTSTSISGVMARGMGRAPFICSGWGIGCPLHPSITGNRTPMVVQSATAALTDSVDDCPAMSPPGLVSGQMR